MNRHGVHLTPHRREEILQYIAKYPDVTSYFVAKKFDVSISTASRFMNPELYKKQKIENKKNYYKRKERKNMNWRDMEFVPKKQFDEQFKTEVKQYIINNPSTSYDAIAKHFNIAVSNLYTWAHPKQYRPENYKQYADRISNKEDDPNIIELSPIVPPSSPEKNDIFQVREREVQVCKNCEVLRKELVEVHEKYKRVAEKNEQYKKMLKDLL